MRSLLVGGKRGGRGMGDPRTTLEGRWIVAFKRMGVVKSRSPFGTVDGLGERRDDKRPRSARQLRPCLPTSTVSQITSFPLSPISHESATTGCKFPARRLSSHGTRNGVPLCRCTPSPRPFLCTVVNLSSKQIVARETISDLVNRSAVENVDTESCTRNGPRGVSRFFFLLTVADQNPQWSNSKRGNPSSCPGDYGQQTRDGPNSLFGVFPRHMLGPWSNLLR